MAKNTILLEMSVIIEIDEVDSVHHEVVRREQNSISNALVDAIDTTLGTEDNSNLGWTGTRYVYLDKSNTNCGRCSICGAWVTDLKKPEPIRALRDATTINGQLLCEDHLPHVRGVVDETNLRQKWLEGINVRPEDNLDVARASVWLFAHLGRVCNWPFDEYDQDLEKAIEVGEKLAALDWLNKQAPEYFARLKSDIELLKSRRKNEST